MCSLMLMLSLLLFRCINMKLCGVKQVMSSQFLFSLFAFILFTETFYVFPSLSLFLSHALHVRQRLFVSHFRWLVVELRPRFASDAHKNNRYI